MLERRSEKDETQRIQQLNGAFEDVHLKWKCKKPLQLMGCSLFFLSYFLASLLMALHIFSTEKANLHNLQIFYERQNCITNHFVFVREDHIR